MLARNIVNQIADTYGQRIPSTEWVPVRQATNDTLDTFVTDLITEHMAATLAPADERARIAARLDELAEAHGEKTAYMLSYDADFLHELAERIRTAPALKGTQ